MHEICGVGVAGLLCAHPDFGTRSKRGGENGDDPRRLLDGRIVVPYPFRTLEEARVGECESERPGPHRAGIGTITSTT